MRKKVRIRTNKCLSTWLFNVVLRFFSMSFYVNSIHIYEVISTSFFELFYVLFVVCLRAFWHFYDVVRPTNLDPRNHPSDAWILWNVTAKPKSTWCLFLWRYTDDCEFFFVVVSHQAATGTTLPFKKTLMVLGTGTSINSPGNPCGISLISSSSCHVNECTHP